jgi:hypothetical protein
MSDRTKKLCPSHEGGNNLLVGTIHPKDAAPLHSVAADVQRKRSGIGPILWNLLESRPLLVAEPKQVRPRPLAPDSVDPLNLNVANCALTPLENEKCRAPSPGLGNFFVPTA